MEETTMSNNGSFSRVATALVGALVLGTTLVGAAVGPAVAHSTGQDQMAYASLDPGHQARG
jgi:hypothetical protein